MAAITVSLSGPLSVRAGGAETVEVEARDIRGLLRVLGEQFPDLKPVLDGGVVVAVGSQIYRDALFQEIPPGSQVTILPKLAGGSR